ncbi:hypothetical protein ACN27F_06240 [Solwaraspora sp. WMMB335]|uniref:hypothetical protein n=1 Tax=Solwaraspora sp. WMMB335 TaxID=3404118 RepID=UPI003B925B62
MTFDPIATVHRDLLVRHLSGWLGAATRQARRATFVQAYDGPDTGAADAALRAVATRGAAGPAGTTHAALPAGCQLSIVTLAGVPAGAGDPAELATRLGAAEAGLPPTVSVHLLPGGSAQLPVAIAATTAARAPLLAYLDLAGGPLPEPGVLRAVASGRPAELLITGAHRPAGDPGRPDRLRQILTGAGFPLVSAVVLRPVGAATTGAPQPRVLAFATGSGKRIEAFKDALWAVDAPGTGFDLCDLADPSAPADSGPLRRTLLAHLTATGPRTVAEIRQFAVTQTVYRASDASRVVAGLITEGLVRRWPAGDRLGGDVVVTAARPGAGPPARSSA